MKQTRWLVFAIAATSGGCGDDSAGTGGGGTGGASSASSTTTSTGSASTTASSSTTASGSTTTAGTGGGGGAGGEGGAGGAPGCEAPTGEGTLHEGVIDADETWTAEGSPHIVTFDTFVDGATLTIEPCAVVRLQAGQGIGVDGSVEAPGVLVARGEADRPILFERDDENEPWGSLSVSSDGQLDLERVTLTGGGHPSAAVATLEAAGDGGNTGLIRNVRVVDVTIDGSGTFGASIIDRAGFTEDSSGLVVQGAGALPPIGNVDTRFALLIHGPALSTIPAGDYTGNAEDEIFVASAASLPDAEITFHERGVPYRLEGHFSMAPVDSAADGGLSTLTLEAGVVIRFGRSGLDVLRLGLGSSNGTAPGNVWPVRLIAAGTESAPIVITSAEANPAAGDWLGIAWAGGPGAGNIMSHVHVEFAGAPSGTSGFGCGPGNNDAAVIINNWRPDDLFITDSTFTDSAGGGIVSGWYSDEVGPNLLGNNTFTSIANGCRVSQWRNADSSCTGEPPLCF